MGGGAGTGASPLDRLKLELELANAQVRPPEEAAKARKANAWEALSMIPGPGNVISAMDAKDAYGAALEAGKSGDTKGAAINTGLGTVSALGAVLGLPVGPVARAANKGAKSRLNAFIPVEKGSKKADRAADMRSEGRDNRQVWEETRAVYDPSGRLLEEVPSNSMAVRRAGFKPGDQTELGKFVDTPVFDRFPQFRHIPVSFTDQAFGGPGKTPVPVFRTTPEGAYDVSLAPGGDMRAGMDKLLQYSVNNTTKLPEALRHGPSEIPDTINDTLARLQAVNPEDRATRDALAAYLDKIVGERDDYLRQITEGVKPVKVSVKTANRNAGNMLASIVRNRAGLPDDVLRTYPYARSATYMPQGTTQRLGAWEDAMALPAAGMSAEELPEFLRLWRTLGAGQPVLPPASSAHTDPWKNVKKHLERQVNPPRPPGRPKKDETFDEKLARMRAEYEREQKAKK